MLSRYIHRLPGALAGVLLLVGCTDRLTQPTRTTTNRSSAILDGARGGNARFYFLPPMVPPPTYTGAFDASQAPVVQICELSGSTCGSTIATLSGSAVKMDLEGESYRAIWKTKDAGLDPAKIYRIRVLLGTTELGYADVVASTGGQLKSVDKNEFVTMINGSALNIRFRIEQGALPPPPPPPPVGPWHDGDVMTFNQTDWGDSTTIDNVLDRHFYAVYASTFGVFEAGLPGATGFSMVFTSPSALSSYLPATGPIGVLTADLVDPTSTSAGAFGGEVVALTLNLNFGDAGVNGAVISADGERAGFVRFGTPTRLGDLALCNYPGLSLNGMTVREILGVLNSVLGGQTSGWDVGRLYVLATELNAAFADGVASPFAQQYLARPGCQPVTWSAGEVTTLTQERWGRGIAAQLLDRHFTSVYGGSLLLGTGGSGFVMFFTSSSAINFYLPAVGPAMPLTATFVDPSSTPAGTFGGNALALRLNIDFADAGYIAGASPLRLGDLTLCGFTGTRAGLNGSSIRTFMQTVNIALGNGLTPYLVTDLDITAAFVNNAFPAGVPGAFAQEHLVRGPCP